MLLKVLASRRREQAAAVTLPSVEWANFDLWPSCGSVELLRVLETGPHSSTSLRIIYVSRSPSRRRPSALLPSVDRRDDRLRGAHGRLWYYCNWAGPMDLAGGGLGAQERAPKTRSSRSRGREAVHARVNGPTTEAAMHAQGHEFVL